MFSNLHCKKFSRNIASKVWQQICALPIAFFLLCSIALADRELVEYTVEGKKVAKNVYKATLLVNESVALIKKNAYERALGKLKLASIIAPDQARTYICTGIIYARQNRNADAITQLKKAVSCRDAPASAYTTLGSLYQTNGDLDGAISTFKAMGKRFSNVGLLDRSDKILALLERERERRTKATGSSKGSTTQGDYLQDALQSGFHKWSTFRMPLKVYIEPAVDVDGHLASYDDLLRQSFYAWAKALNRKVSFVFVNDPDKADIQCHWTNDPSELGDGTENGETKIRFIGETIVAASIALRAKEPEGDFPFSDNLVFTTCVHEAGHALGLSGHSPNPEDVMFFSVPLADVERTVTERDKNTMLKIYSKEQALQYVLIDFLINPVNSALVGLAVFLLVLLGIIVPRLAKRSTKKRR